MPRPALKAVITEKDSPRDFWANLKHFKPTDFRCRCDIMCDHQNIISEDLVTKLELLREAIGLPVKINSGSRCKRYNEGVVHGSPNSPHVPNGNGTTHAVDIHVPDNHYLYQLLNHSFLLGFSGIGIGKGWVHLEDIPSQNDRKLWVYPSNKKK